MSVDAEQKMLGMMASKKIFLKKYNRAKQLFCELVDRQSRLLVENSQKKEGNDTPDKIDVKESINFLNEIMDMLLETDPLILNSIKDYFSINDYLFQHSLGVCYIGSIVLQRFNKLFSQHINNMLITQFKETLKHRQADEMAQFYYYPPEAVRTISLGYLLHDMGKIKIPPSLLNKKSELTAKDLKEVQKHAGEYGAAFLTLNGIHDVYVENIVKYHHAAIYLNEKNSYPDYESPSDLPPYVKICKVADKYSAMTLKRSYGEAVNPTKVVNTIFKEYSGRDPVLQLILYSFVKEVGTCPAGSILTLKNGQSVYVVNSRGPEVIIFTDPDGKTSETTGQIVNLSSPESKRQNLIIDGQHLPKTPVEMFNRLPAYLQEFHLEKPDENVALTPETS
ncbi:HD domain-containing protein [uncultured Desulfobacter sp.]|uniref:HD-GYP domain-containing protein n=1 Tax=uncultured Desulfobacter sp. TaxID=240139 RepID=UPI002AABDDD6|nr:HD domain-containing protein [uncultured Desulfobacter sp.]